MPTISMGAIQFGEIFMNEESVQKILKELDYVYHRAMSSNDMKSMVKAVELKINFSIHLDSRESNKQV